MAQRRKPGPRRRGPRPDGSKIYRKQPVQERSQATVDIILSAAGRILAQTGYERFTTHRVARLAGVSVGSLYQYFPSKQALVAALLDRHAAASMEGFRKRMRQVAQPSLEEVMRGLVESLAEAHREHPQLHRVFVEELPSTGPLVAKVRAAKGAFATRTGAYLAAHAAEVKPQNHALSGWIVTTAIDALIHEAVVSRPELLNGSELASEIGDLIMSYLERDARARDSGQAGGVAVNMR